MDRHEKLNALRARIAAVETIGGNRRPKGGARLGIAAIERCLPDGRLAAGGLHGLAGTAAYSFAAFLLRQLAGPALWCRRIGGRSVLYPPGFLDHGIDPAGLTLVGCRNPAELLQSAEEALRCPALGAVVLEAGKPLDLTTSRRLQLASQAGGTSGFLILGPATARGGPLALLTAWEVEAALPPGGTPGETVSRFTWRLRLVRCRNGRGGIWTVTWNVETNCLNLVSLAGDGPAESAVGQRLAG